MSEAQYRVEWMEEPQAFKGDIAASMALAGDHWRSVGARFVQLDDDQTGVFDMAAGKVEFPGGAVEFGLVDYGSDVTYLLAPASGAAKDELATLALVALAEAGVMSIDDVLDESNPYEEPSLIERLTILEDWAGAEIAEEARTAVPVAVDVVVSGEPMTYYEHSLGGSTFRRHRRRVGTVKAFDVGSGGVISPEGGGKEIYLPPGALQVDAAVIKAGAKVTFRYGIRARGEAAADVPADLEVEGS